MKIEEYLITKEDKDRLLVGGELLVNIAEDIFDEMIMKYNNLMKELVERHDTPREWSRG